MDSGLLEMRILNASDKAAEARHRVIMLEQLVSELSKRVADLEKTIAKNTSV